MWLLRPCRSARFTRRRPRASAARARSSASSSPSAAALDSLFSSPMACDSCAARRSRSSSPPPRPRSARQSRHESPRARAARQAAASAREREAVYTRGVLSSRTARHLGEQYTLRKDEWRSRSGRQQLQGEPLRGAPRRKPATGRLASSLAPVVCASPAQEARPAPQAEQASWAQANKRKCTDLPHNTGRPCI
jgi:hypothetical protein